MRKVVVVCLVLISFFLVAAVLSGCSGSSLPRTTSQLAFIRDTGLPALGAAARATHMSPIERRAQMQIRARQVRRARTAATAASAADIAPGSRSVYVRYVDRAGETLLGQSGDFDFVQLSPDGTKGVFSAYDSNGYIQVYTVDMSNPTTPTQITSDAEDHYEPQMSRDNSKIVYVKWNSTASMDEMYTISSSGGAETLVSTPNVDTWSPTFNPDGTKIVFAGWGASDNAGRIYIVKTDGTGLEALTLDRTTGWDYYPSVSPDGTTIAFERYISGTGFDVYTVAITGEAMPGATAATRLTTDGESGDPLYVSNKIVFVSWRTTPTDADGDYDIWSMNYDGTSQAALTTDTNEDYFSYEWY